MKAAAASPALAYWSIDSVTFFVPSALVKTTEIDAVALPTLVWFGPVPASFVTSGKDSVTALSGTTVSRGRSWASATAANGRTTVAINKAATNGPRGRFIFVP